MATNKHASIRYNALDRCFSNFQKKYFIDDLIEACNEAIYEFTGNSEGIKRRQLFDDIKFMESDQGYAIPLDRCKDGKKVFYRYSDRNFTISKNALSAKEVDQVTDTLIILNRLQHLPGFEWVSETQVRLKKLFDTTSELSEIVSFSNNPYLTGLEYFEPIYQAIQSKQTLEIEYQSFKSETAEKHILHPWYLKQYNNRWFLLGLNNNYNTLSNFALDRIKGIRQASIPFKVNDSIDFNDYFEDVIGVTINDTIPVETIVIEVAPGLLPYIKSKPLHGSQKTRISAEGTCLIELRLQVNREFKALLFSFMDEVKVIEPEHLKIEFATIAQKILNYY